MAKYTCSCGARYKFPDSALGKRAKCKKCGAVFTLEVEDEGIFALADEPEFSQPSHLENPVDPEVAASQQQQGEVFTTAGHPRSRGLHASDAMQLDGEQTSKKSFISDVLKTFLIPAAPKNLISFFIVCFAMVMGTFGWYLAYIGVFIPMVGALVTMLGYLLMIVVIGWYSAYRLMVIASAAAGEDKIPEIDASLGSWTEYMGHFFKWMGSWTIAMIPVLIYIVFMLVQGGATPFTVIMTVIEALATMTSRIGGMIDVSGSDIGLYDALVLMGMFIWPMIIMCIALGGFSVFHQPDLIFLAMMKTIHAYTLTVILILGVVVGQSVMWKIIAGQISSITPSTISGIMGSSISLGILLTCVSVYFEIVLMRLIGLYYYHFKHKFAWSWE